MRTQWPPTQDTSCLKIHTSWKIFHGWGKKPQVLVITSSFRDPASEAIWDEFSTQNHGAHTNIAAIVTRGRFAGKKVVVVRPHDDGTKSHSFSHAIVVGIERGPQRITKRHNAKQVSKRCRVKPFVKLVNYNHLMPTRYSLDVESFKNAVTPDSLKEPSQKEEAKKVVRKALEEKHQAGKNKWFFTKLRF